MNEELSAPKEAIDTSSRRFRWVRYQDRWEVAMVSLGKYWLTASDHSYDTDFFQELGSFVTIESISQDPRFARFGEAMWNYITRQGGDFCGEEISEDILPLAESAGLCRRVQYDPSLHGEGIEAYPGREIWWWENEELSDLNYMFENTETNELQRRLHDAHESSAMLRARIEELESWVAEGKRNGARCAEERDSAAELLAEIMRDEVNAQDEAEKWLRAYSPHLLGSDNG